MIGGVGTAVVNDRGLWGSWYGCCEGQVVIGAVGTAVVRDSSNWGIGYGCCEGQWSLGELVRLL